MRKPTKTISGVAPLAVMLSPRKCNHGTCLFCPTLNAPQSYTPESPAVLRAASLNYDPYKQVKSRLEAFKAMKHPTTKIELIIMGGTFLEYDKKFQENFILQCYNALNNKQSKTLEQAKKLNQTATHRCVALCIETRPDVCTDEQIKDILNYGCTRVELGVQAIDDKIYKKVQRGHTIKDVISATKRLKQAGFKIGYHLMPGIPGSNLKKDIKMYKKIFTSQDYKPDQVKLYPCQVLKGAELEKNYFNKTYKPYTKEQTKQVLIQMIKLTPRYCRIMRIMREIPPWFLTAGLINIDLRKDIELELREQKSKIKEIRFREIGFFLRDNPNKELDIDVKIKITKYKASDGTEYFIEAVNKQDILFGLARLRIENPNQDSRLNNKNKTPTAMIRELHVYGPSVNIGKKGKYSQHLGLGKQLMKTAEDIAKKSKCNHIKVISGIGVREYYKKLNYKLDKDKIYMEKDL